MSHKKELLRSLLGRAQGLKPRLPVSFAAKTHRGFRAERPSGQAVLMTSGWLRHPAKRILRFWVLGCSGSAL